MVRDKKLPGWRSFAPGSALTDSIWPSTDTLPPALHTGYRRIDEEHAHLLACMRTLKQICSAPSHPSHCTGCTCDQRVSCEDDLVSILGDLLAFILDHFEGEERLMRDTLLKQVDRAVFDAHMEDHAAISGKVQEIVARLNPQETIRRIRELEALLDSWVNNHVQLHDVLFARWLEQQRQGNESL